MNNKIDINFLAGAIKLGEIVVRDSAMKTMLIIHENYDNRQRKIKGWEALSLRPPEAFNNAVLSILDGDKEIQSLSLDEYSMISSLKEIKADCSAEKVLKNQSMLVEYFRQKINEYDNVNTSDDVNKKL